MEIERTEVERLVIVTGGSSGLGKAILEALNAQGQDQLLVNIARRTASLEQPLNAGNQLLNISANLHESDNIDSAQQALSQLIAAHSFKEAFIIHNAGQVTPVGMCHQLTDVSAIDNALRLNVSSVVALNATFLQSVPAHCAQKVLLISSGAGRGPVSGWAVYGATKAALDYYAQVFHQENPNIPCVSLAPGVIDTDMQATIRAQDTDNFPPIERFLQLHREQQLQSPKDTARRIVRYLFSATFGQQVIDDIRHHPAG